MEQPNIVAKISAVFKFMFNKKKNPKFKIATQGQATPNTSSNCLNVIS